MSNVDIQGLGGAESGAASDVSSWSKAPDRRVWLELRRKQAHMLPGLLPFVLWFVWHEDPLPAWNLAIVVAVVAVLTMVAIISSRGRTRDTRENWIRTCLTYSLPPLGVLLLFPGQAEYALVTLTVLAFGDTAAAIAGRLFGRRRLPWNPDKTWVGLGCFVLFSAPLAALTYWGEARPSVSIDVAIACGAVPALLAGLAESLRSRLDDNLRISLAAAVGVVVTSGLLLPGA